MIIIRNTSSYRKEADLEFNTNTSCCGLFLLGRRLQQGCLGMSSAQGCVRMNTYHSSLQGLICTAYASVVWRSYLLSPWDNSGKLSNSQLSDLRKLIQKLNQESFSSVSCVSLHYTLSRCVNADVHHGDFIEEILQKEASLFCTLQMLFLFTSFI